MQRISRRDKIPVKNVPSHTIRPVGTQQPLDATAVNYKIELDKHLIDRRLLIIHFQFYLVHLFMKYAYILLFLILFVLPLPAQTHLQTPAQFLGYSLGEQFTTHDKMIRYVEHAAAPPLTVPS